jgi:hypothetical protein
VAGFAVVDMTLRFQRWERDPFQKAIAPALLIERPRVVRARAEDVVAPAVRQACAAHTGRHDPNLHIRLFPDQERVLAAFSRRVGPGSSRCGMKSAKQRESESAEIFARDQDLRPGILRCCAGSSIWHGDDGGGGTARLQPAIA